MTLWQQIKTLVYNEVKYGEKGLGKLDRITLCFIGVIAGGAAIYFNLLYVGIAAISISSYLAGYYTGVLK